MDDITNNISGNPLKEFALTDDIKSKSDKAFGLRIAQNIERNISSLTVRNDRFRANRELANGRVDVYKRFGDRFDFDGKPNYIALAWKSIKIVNTICSRLVGRWMARNMKIHVTAIDTFSKKEKEENYKKAEFILDNKELLGQLQVKSGVPQVAADDYIAEDKDDLDLWAAEYNQLPQEIKYSQACNNILQINGFFDVNEEKCLHDSAQVGFIGTHVEMGNDGVITIRPVEPENATYSYSRYADLRDTTWRGEVLSWKISEVRAKYGIQNGGTMTEQEIFDTVVSKAKDYQVSDKITWRDSWAVSWFRPYDDWTVDVHQFYYKTYDTDVYKMKVSKSGTLIVEKDPKDNQGERVSKDKWNLYKGVHIRGSDVMLEWGIQNNMIKSQDPKELGDVEFPFSFYMYQNQDMRNLAVPEKIEDPVDQMVLARLKMQQLIASSKPPGSAINWDAMQEIDYGLGDTNKTIDPVKLYNQTGTFYYRGRDAESNPIPVPIQDIPNAGFVPQMQALIEMYRYNYQVLKDELGEDPNLINAASTPRVTSENINTAQQEAEFATDYMFAAYTRCIEDTSRKIACLLHDSVDAKAKAYSEILKEEDVKDRVFYTNVKMLPNDIELSKLEQMMNNAILSNPTLVLYLDQYKILRIAKENIVLAETFFRRAQRRAIEGERQQAQEASKYNGDIQVQSLQAKAQADAQMKQMEGQIDIAKATATGEAQNKSAIINMVSAILSKGLPIDATVLPLIQTTIQNLMIPMAVQNEQEKQQIIQATQKAFQNQQQGGQPQEQQPMTEQQPQPQQQVA